MGDPKCHSLFLSPTCHGMVLFRDRKYSTFIPKIHSDITGIDLFRSEMWSKIALKCKQHWLEYTLGRMHWLRVIWFHSNVGNNIG